MRTKIALVAAVAAPLWAQSDLSIRDAARMALGKHPSIAASEAQVKAAATRIDQARSGYLPRVNYTESWARSNNPVFVFSSLLTQHLFTEQNFAVGPLNRPDAMNNFQSQVVVDQVLYDGGQTKAAIRSAELGRSMAGEEGRRTQMDVIVNVVRAYYGALLAEESLKVADEAVRSAEADLKRAETVRAAGMATDADVLAIRVHLAAVREQRIQRGYDADVAHAALNEALGLPLDTKHRLTSQLAPATLAPATLEGIEKTALESRPEVRQVDLAARLAETQSRAARSSLLPQIGFRGAFEADRQRFVNRGGANWMASASLRWNIFNGFADKARIEEAAQALRRAEAQKRQASAGVQLQARQAYLNLKAAEERIAVASAAVAMAEENLRIIKNRYEGGLTNVTELLRSETALLEASFRRLAANHNQRLAAAALEQAAGTLTADSEALN